MQVTAMIPARYGSTRFPGKMLTPICGKPLIQLTYENAFRCQRLNRIVVLTDDARIQQTVLDFGGEVVMTSSDCLTGTDRMVEALNHSSFDDNSPLILNIQGDEPCVEPSVITAVIEALESDSLSAMSTAVFQLEEREEIERPHRVKCVFDRNHHALYFSRAVIPHGLNGYSPEIAYYGHIGLYCFKREFLLNYGSLPPSPLQLAENLEQLKAIEYGYKIKIAIVDTPSVGVDTPEDRNKIEKILCQKNTFSLLEECVPL